VTTTAATSIPNLPPELQSPLPRLRDDLVTAVGDDLVALAVYGSAARGRWRVGKSDVNVLVVLKRVDAAALDAIAAPLREAFRAVAADPLVIAADELPQSAAAFPSKFMEIQRYHVMLHGSADVLAGLNFPRDAVLRRIEQEFLNLELRLRRRYLEVREDRDLLTKMLRDAAVPLSVSLLALLETRGRADGMPDKTRAAIFQRAAEVFGLDAQALRRLNALRHEETPATEAKALFAVTLGVLRRCATLKTNGGGA
jgi:predicted nucleotidyltransferase